MASTRLYRTFGTPTLATKYTCSFWMKRGNITVLQYIFNSYSDANNWGILRFNADHKLEFFQHSGSFKARGAVNNILNLSDKQKNAKTLLEGVEEFRNKAKQVLSEKNQQKKL